LMKNSPNLFKNPHTVPKLKKFKLIVDLDWLLKTLIS
jgi:hypothetical protein